MIGLEKIVIKDTISFVEARNKIHLLAQDLQFDDLGAVRLATITSELSRLIYQNGNETTIDVGFDNLPISKKGNIQEETIGLILLFKSRKNNVDITRVDLFFDRLETIRTPEGFMNIKAFKALPQSDFKPTTEFITAERDKLLQVSKRELFGEVRLKLNELEEKNAALEKATQLKSEFLANMSHELRTPLNSIIGFTHRVIKKSAGLLPEKQLKNLATVERNGHHLLGLINSLLDLSKIEAGKMDIFPEEFELGELIDEVLELNRPLIMEKGLKSVTIIPDEKIVLYSDKTKLKQILINLVNNALKFTNEGSITVKVEKVNQQAANSRNYSESTTKHVALSVIDTGPGLSREEMDIVFESFRQVDGSTTRSIGGTGLGLSIVKSFAELLDGKIEVNSQIGKGSIFTLFIPCQTESEIHHPVDDAPGLPLEQQPRQGVPTVLCVDDNPEALDLLQSYLHDAGYHVALALSADEGIKKARELQPLAITLDIQMPYKDGWTALNELKNDTRTQDIPVIIVSMMENKKLGFSLGAFDYLQKPIDPENLMNAIGTITHQKIETILAADDDPAVIDLISQIFEDESITLRTAKNGLEAIESLEEVIPDVMLLDLMMPVMDGFEVINRLKQNNAWHTIPVIIITAKSLNSGEKKFLHEKVESIITKGDMDTDNVLCEIVAAIKKLENRS